MWFSGLQLLYNKVRHFSGVVLLMVMATTFVSPLFLKSLAARTHRSA